MYFHLLKITQKIFISIFFISLCSSELFAFKETVKSVYSSDKELSLLQKGIKNPPKRDLQTAQRDDNNTHESLQYSIDLRKEYLFLQTLYYHLKKEQKEKEITLIKDVNKKLFNLYDAKIQPNISKYNKKTLQDTTQELQKAKNLLEEHQKELQKLNKKHKALADTSNKDFKIIQTIETTPLVQNAQKSFSLFSKRTELEKKLTQKSLRIGGHEVKSFLEGSYHNYLNLLKRFQNSKKEVFASNKKLQDKSAPKQITHKVTLLENLLKQESIRFKILLEKISIFYTTGLLKPLLFEANTLSLMPRLPEKLTQTEPVKTLKKIHFVGNSSAITSYSMPIVKSHAKKLQKMQNFILELHGHSDSKGDTQRNYELSLERVNKVKNTLIDFGVSKKNIKIFAHGDTAPIATNKTKQGRLLSRRVEFKIEEK